MSRSETATSTERLLQVRYHSSAKQNVFEHGFTLVELLVGVSLGLLVLSFFSTNFVSNRRQAAAELRRIESNSNLQMALELVGAELRSVGARLVESFPALIVIDGGDRDQIIARRAVVPGLPVCQGIAAGSSSGSIIAATDVNGSVRDSSGSLIFVDDGAGKSVPLVSSTCVNDAAALRSADGWTKAFVPRPTLGGYLFDRNSKVAHPFAFGYIGSMGDLVIAATPEGGSWPSAFPPLTSSAYLVEQVNFRLSASGSLEAIRSDFPDQPMSVISSVKKFDIKIKKTDVDSVTGTKTTTLKSSFQASDNWRTIDSVIVAITLSDKVGNEFSASGGFTPRNVFSAKWH